MDQITAYGHPDIGLSIEWTPSTTTCAAVESHGGSSSGAFSYVSNGQTCSTECGQAATTITKYDCKRADGLPADPSQCASLSAPSGGVTENCPQTADCAPTIVDVDTCSHCKTNQAPELVPGSITCQTRSDNYDPGTPEHQTYVSGTAPKSFDFCMSGGHGSNNGGTWASSKSWCQHQGLELWTMSHQKDEWASTAAYACGHNMCWMDLRCVADDDTCNTPAGWKWPNGQSVSDTGYNQFGKCATPVMKINYSAGKTCANFGGWGSQNCWQPKKCDEYSRVVCVNASTNVIGGL